MLFFFFVLSFFPRDVLDEILDLIESVSEGFHTYSLMCLQKIPSVLYMVVGTVMSLIRFAQLRKLF